MTFDLTFQAVLSTCYGCCSTVSHLLPPECPPTPPNENLLSRPSSGGLSRDNRTIPECNIDLNSGQIRAAIINYFPRPAPLPGQAGPGGARAGGGDRRHEYLVMQTVQCYRIELQTKVIRSYAKNSQSRRRPPLGPLGK